MSYYRSYFKKNNTIIKDSFVNTSKNPNTEIYYGDGYSKFLFQVDFSDLIAKINDGEFIVNSNTKHYLNLTNCIFGAESFVGQEKESGGYRASSFDLTLFPLTENWDEGVGYDYTYVNDQNNNKTYDIRPSNWFQRTTLEKWGTDGIYNTLPNDAITIHFDNGNENINVDITNYVNNIISGQTNNGFVLSFGVDYYDLKDSKQSVSFFSKYTQTFFEPYVETVFDDVINDNRNDFYNDVERNLYLYVTRGGKPFNLDVLPTVSILDDKNSVFDASLSNMTPEHVKKGVYKVTIGLTGYLCNGRRFYYDNWTNIFINGIKMNDVKQRFIPKPSTELYTIGDPVNENLTYVIKYNGVKMNEKIKRGETRKVSVILKTFENRNNLITDELYYRIYIKEGKTQVNVFDWTKLDKTNENSFMLDTSFLIPREYNLEIKSKINTEEIFYNEEIKFEIVSEK